MLSLLLAANLYLDGKLIPTTWNLAGADCSNGASIVPAVPGSQWSVSGGVWTLVGCPLGYTLQGQQCDKCPAAWYCPGGSIPATSCGSGLFSLPGAAFPASCFPVVYTVITTLVPVPRQEFTDAATVTFQNTVASLLGVNNGYVLLSAISQSASATSTSIVVNIANADADSAAKLAKSIDSNTFVAGLAVNGFPNCSLKSVAVTACLPGYELVSSICKICTAGYYCVGDSAPSKPCPVGYFALPGANASAMCKLMDFVIVTAVIQLSGVIAGTSGENDLAETIEDKFQNSLATVANVAPETIVVTISTQFRRSASNSVQLSAEIAVPLDTAASVAGRISREGLNKQLQQQGIPQVSQVSVTATGVSASGGSSVALIIGVVVGCFAAIVVSITAVYLSSKSLTESDDDRLLRSAMEKLRKRLGITIEDGFVLSTETVTAFQFRFGKWASKTRKSIETTVIRRSYLESAARLSLLQVCCRMHSLAC